MKNTLIILFFLFFSFLKGIGYAQCGMPPTSNCDPTTSDIILTTPDRIELFFDSFSEYKGGISLNGSSIIRLKVDANLLPPSPCQWKLSMIVTNNGWGIPSEWETTVSYGGAGSGVPPALDLLEFRVSNVCNTPLNSGIWQNFAPLTGSVIDVINNVALIPSTPGICDLQTNGEGSYLSNYNEYSFIIDYRLIPFDAALGFIYRPGRYELHIKFCLQEM